ncbi:unnamed protein product [Periconia digitata]|uniref:Uncharacterized protein n=1 Tax=Periconia digitata TaxID=1303443 RepID=A0A9W4UTY6_9PLEO|nr:unnamed protein product [Periconia digitata]
MFNSERGYFHVQPFKVERIDLFITFLCFYTPRNFGSHDSVDPLFTHPQRYSLSNSTVHASNIIGMVPGSFRYSSGYPNTPIWSSCSFSFSFQVSSCQSTTSTFT